MHAKRYCSGFTYAQRLTQAVEEFILEMTALKTTNKFSFQYFRNGFDLLVKNGVSLYSICKLIYHHQYAIFYKQMGIVSRKQNAQ